MKSHSYMTRAMQARDPRFARILGKLGYGRADIVAAPAPQTPTLADVREEYERVVGKRPYHAWDIETLREKMVAHQAAT